MKKQREIEKDPSHDNPLAIQNGCKFTSKEILKSIEESRILQSPTKLTVEDTEKLLNALQNDGVVESSLSGSIYLWRLSQNWAPTPTLLRTACGICPVSYVLCNFNLYYYRDLMMTFVFLFNLRSWLITLLNIMLGFVHSPFATQPKIYCLFIGYSKQPFFV